MKTAQDLKNCFDEIIKLCEKSNADLEVFCEVFDDALDDLLGDDFFWTEWQCDPRWDRRDL